MIHVHRYLCHTYTHKMQYIYTHIDTYTHTHKYIYTHTLIHIHIYCSIYTHMYLYILHFNIFSFDAGNWRSFFLVFVCQILFLARIFFLCSMPGFFFLAGVFCCVLWQDVFLLLRSMAGCFVCVVFYARMFFFLLCSMPGCFFRHPWLE